MLGRGTSLPQGKNVRPQPSSSRSYSQGLSPISSFSVLTTTNKRLSALARPDVVKVHFGDFIVWIEEALKSPNVFLVTGALAGLSSVFRHGKREDLLGVVDLIYPLLAVGKRLGKNNAAARKLWIKLTQRVGLCYLRPRIASWRYKRGFRSLLSATGPSLLSASATPKTPESAEDDWGEDEEIPETIEEVIGAMLESLGDKSTVVRWSAAKGVGRITERLPKYLGDDVVGSVIQSLTDRVFSLLCYSSSSFPPLMKNSFS